MKRGSSTHAMLGARLLLAILVPPAFGKSAPTDPNRYLNAVREFADNVLKYGRDTYGPKHTPLFVDGLNVHTHEPVKWIAPNGERWILSNLASQQNLFRTLDGLTKVTGDPKYKQAAMDAIKYAFENLRSPNGLLYWGGHSAYDAAADRPCGRNVHELKGCYPYYELMWEVDPQATRQYIEAFWAGHIRDWSNLDMDRHCYDMVRPLGKAWDYDYRGAPVFSRGSGMCFFTTGSDLCYAAAILSRLNDQETPLQWSKRLTHRYVETRNPNTGIAAFVYNIYTGNRVKRPTLRELKDHGLDVAGLDRYFPAVPTYADPDVQRCWYGYCMVSPGIPYSVAISPWMCSLLVGETLGSHGKEFIQWSREELTAMGKVGYRKSSNSWIPMLRDGISLESLVVSKGGAFGPDGMVLKPIPAVPMDFWIYAAAYRLTEDQFMWQMARDIAMGNGFGDIGPGPDDSAEPRRDVDCADPYALIGFLELYKKTQREDFLSRARQIGDNILTHRFHAGFFTPGTKYVYTKFDGPESLALLHLHAANMSPRVSAPSMWPGLAFFEDAYRDKDPLDDTSLIYRLTGTSEPVLSLQEAAATGNIDLVRSLLEKGAGVDEREDSFFKTALHRAAMAGHTGIAELLLAEGANPNARDSGVSIPLHYAAQNGHKETANLLIAKGADVNTKNGGGDPSLEGAARYDHKDVIQLLLEKGAAISTLHLAAHTGDLAKAESLIQEGSNINALDGYGYAPLHYAAKNDQKAAAKLLVAKGADVNVKNWGGETPLFVACGQGHMGVAELLVDKGADISTADNSGNTPLHRVTQDGRKDVAELLIAKSADVNARNRAGRTPLDIAADRDRKDVVELLLAKGAMVSTLHQAVHLGAPDRVKAFLEDGADVNAKDGNGQTALHVAVGGKHREVAELLLAKGADVNAKDGKGYPPLYSAIWSNDANMVGLLVSKGADVNTTPEKDYSPLHYAVWFENVDIVRVLVDHGAKFDMKDQQGWTAFRYAASAGSRELVDLFMAKGADVSSLPMAACAGHLARVKELVEQGADLNAKDELGWTPLYWAASMGREEVAAFLIDKGTKVDARTNDEQTALQQAAQAGVARLVELLIFKGADVNARDKNGKAPLHAAASSGRREVVELLTARDADVNAKTTNGWTALHMAALAGQKEVVEVLLAKGADVNAKDKQGRTPADLAERRGHQEVADLLRRQGQRGKESRYDNLHQ